jgi:hypothetical protein
MSNELPGPRSLEQAKAWMLEKLDARVHPMGLTDVSATRQVIAGLGGLDGQSWAAAWMARGDDYAARAAEAQERGDAEAARDAWYQAYAFYFLGRFPARTTPKSSARMTRRWRRIRLSASWRRHPSNVSPCRSRGGSERGKPFPSTCGCRRASTVHQSSSCGAVWMPGKRK